MVDSLKTAIPITLINLLLLIASQMAFATINDVNNQHPQYGFAHRVNDKSMIKHALLAKANGIEIDICYSSSTAAWHVNHNDLGNCATGDSLKDWVTELKSVLASNSELAEQFSILWYDIKTANQGDLLDAVKVTREFGPDEIWVMYDLNVFNDKSKIGFQKIYQHLNSQESISFSPSTTGTVFTQKPNIDDVDKIYNYFKSNRFTRGTFNYGDSFNINHAVLTKANEKKYNNPNDPYRFKKIFTWTIVKKSSMEDFINSANAYHTDGQIVGQWYSGWEPNFSNIYLSFLETVNTYASSERMAVNSDDPWI